MCQILSEDRDHVGKNGPMYTADKLSKFNPRRGHVGPEGGAEV
jgi:hypothetical protein